MTSAGLLIRNMNTCNIIVQSYPNISILLKKRLIFLHLLAENLGINMLCSISQRPDECLNRKASQTYASMYNKTIY